MDNMHTHHVMFGTESYGVDELYVAEDLEEALSIAEEEISRFIDQIGYADDRLGWSYDELDELKAECKKEIREYGLTKMPAEKDAPPYRLQQYVTIDTCDVDGCDLEDDA